MGYPSGVYSATPVSNGQIIDASRDNAQDAELTALSNGLLNGIAHAVTVSTGGLTVSTGSVNIGGPSSLATVHVNGASTFVGAVTFSSGVTFSAAPTFSTGLTVSAGTAILTGQVRYGTQSMTLSGGSSRFDNLAVASSATVVYIGSNSTQVLITGITGGTDGRVIYLINNQNGVIVTIGANDANSSADCRIQLSSNTNKALNALGTIGLTYSTATNFWYGLGV